MYIFYLLSHKENNLTQPSSPLHLHELPTQVIHLPYEDNPIITTYSIAGYFIWMMFLLLFTCRNLLQAAKGGTMSICICICICIYQSHETNRAIAEPIPKSARKRKISQKRLEIVFVFVYALTGLWHEVNGSRWHHVVANTYIVYQCCCCSTCCCCCCYAISFYL